MSMHTDVSLSDGRGLYTVCPSLDAVPKGKRVVVLAEDCAAHFLDCTNGRLRCSRRCDVDGGFQLFSTLTKLFRIKAEDVKVRSGHTLPKSLIPSCTSCTQPLSSSSRAVMGFSGDEVRRPCSIQCCILSKFTGAYTLAFLSYYSASAANSSQYICSTHALTKPLFGISLINGV